MKDMNCDKWFYTVLALIGLFFVWSLIIFRYYLRVSKKSLELGSADKQHEYKHAENAERIKKLEEKNEGLNNKITLLEGFLDKLTKIQPIYQQAPTNLPKAKEQKKSQAINSKKGGWNGIYGVAKKHRKVMGKAELKQWQMKKKNC